MKLCCCKTNLSKEKKASYSNCFKNVVMFINSCLTLMPNNLLEKKFY